VLRAALAPFRPTRVVAFRDAGKAGDRTEALPLLAGKTADGAVTTFVCQNYACQAPLVGVEAAERVLR